MALPASGSISLSQVNVELGLSATAQISMNDAAVRTLFGRASGANSMSDGRGKANQFAFTISSNQTNANLATLATAAGWNGTSKIVATIASGVYCSSNSTGTPALTVNGSFPGGVELVNNGYIIGMGGAGGRGVSPSSTSPSYSSYGTAGAAGGTALSVSAAVSITNNGTIAGGGGGGGGGRGGIRADSIGDFQYTYSGFASGGGGGGRSSAAANSAGGARGTSFYNGGNGGAGTVSAAGGGGGGGANGYGSYAAGGGSGGGWGSGGASGGSGTQYLYTTAGPYSGGAAGGAVTGNSNITWVATGTRLGAIA